MPNPPKKFPSKAERQVAAYQGRRSKFNKRQDAAKKQLREEQFPRTRDDLSEEEVVDLYPILGEYFPSLKQEYGKALGRGATAPSSQVKKTKMSPRKLGKMGAAINTGKTPQRDAILKAIQRLPMSQQRKIYKALKGHVMD